MRATHTTLSHTLPALVLDTRFAVGDDVVVVLLLLLGSRVVVIVFLPGCSPLVVDMTTGSDTVTILVVEVEVEVAV